MLRETPFYRLTQMSGQRVPREMHVGEQGIAAFGRQLLCMQQRAEARFFLVREVRVPEMARVAETNRLAVLDDIRHDQYLRISRQLELVQHMDLQRAKAAAKGDLLVRRDALVAKHQYVVIEVRAMNAREILVNKRLIQIEAQDFRA